MAAPTNTSFLTATSLGTSLPVTVTQEVDFAGTTYDVYYSYTAQAGDGEIGVWAFGDLVTYKPTLTVYLGPAGAPTSYMTGFAALNVPIQMPTRPGVQYFFKIATNVGNPAPANLTLNVQLSPRTATIPAGAIGVTDSTNVFGDVQFPTVFINGTTGTPVFFYDTQPTNGEWATVWANGTTGVLSDDESTTVIRIYSNQMQLLSTSIDPLGGGVTLRSLTSDVLSRFYTSGIGVSTVAAVNSSGGVIRTWTVSASADNLGVLQDNSVLYYTTAAGVSAIHRHNLVTDTVMTDLSASVANYTLGQMQILGLKDGTLIAGYVHTGAPPQDFFLRHYDQAGTVLHTYSIGTVGIDPRIAMAIDDPNSFWIWTKGYAGAATKGVGTFTNLKVSDGSTITTFNTQEYIEGVFDSTATATPTRFGHDESCAFWVARGQQTIAFTTTPRIIRRVRRAPHIAQLGQRVYINRFLLDMQTGIGLDGALDQVGSNPTVMLRWSKNGGQTFSQEVEMHAGELGHYFKRVYFWRLGMARDWIFEISVSDPVAWAIMAAVLDVEPGTN